MKNLKSFEKKSLLKTEIKPLTKSEMKSISGGDGQIYCFSAEKITLGNATLDNNWA